MRTFALVAIFALVALSTAETMSAARLRGYTSAMHRSVSQEASFLTLKKTTFGQNLFNMLSLKFKSTGKLDSILALLTQLETDINNQQAQDDSEFGTQKQTYETRIQNARDTIAAAEIRIGELETEQRTKTQERDQKVVQRNNLNQEKENIENFLERLAETRQAEAEAFEVRIEDQKAMIAGIDAVLEIFDNELSGNAELDAESVATVRAALVDVRGSVSESIVSDTQAENDAKVKYDLFVAEQNARLVDINQQVNNLTAEINNLNTRLEQIVGELEDQHRQINAANQIIDTTTEALTNLINQYNENKATRSQQVVLIGQVRAELTNNPDNVQNFLNSA